jgi:Pyridoxamine 5'-phosphate oxidase
MPGLDRVRDIGARESGLAVAITTRADGLPRASVVNAGVLDHPVTGDRIVGFVARGTARKLTDLRERPQVTVVFRSGWEWLAVEGDADLAGPVDRLEGLPTDQVPALVRMVYAAAVGGSPDEWGALDESFAAEGHTAVLVRVARVYPTDDPAPPGIA